MAEQTIRGNVDIRSLNIIFSLTAGYGLHRVPDRRSLWTDLHIYIARVMDHELLWKTLMVQLMLSRLIGNPVPE